MYITFYRAARERGNANACEGGGGGGEKAEKKKTPAFAGVRLLSPVNTGTRQRGRRDSNPQPPDRQSGEGIQKSPEKQGDSGSEGDELRRHCADELSERFKTYPDLATLAALVEHWPTVWPSLPDAVRRHVRLILAFPSLAG